MGWQNLVTRLVRPNERKASATGPLIAWSGVGRPKWTPRRYDALADEGFRKNVIAYRCVCLLAHAVASVPWLLYDETNHEIEQNAWSDLIEHPNPLQDRVAFIEAVASELLLSGNAFIEAVRGGDDDVPTELYLLRSDRMKVIPGDMGLPQGYQYDVNGRSTRWAIDPLTGEGDILHIKTFHPLDDWYGLAPIEAALVSVDQHNAAGAWNQALLNQGARPSGALVYAPKEGPATLSDDQVQRLREELGQLYNGPSNAGRPLILEGGLDWREMSLSPKDMDWIAGRDAAARDIALAFGVPPQLIGLPDSQTYSNYAEARLAFYEESVLPLFQRIVSAFNHWISLCCDEEVRFEGDLDQVSALAAKRDALWTKLENASFLTVNEKREALGYDPVEGGNVVSTSPSGSK